MKAVYNQFAFALLFLVLCAGTVNAQPAAPENSALSVAVTEEVLNIKKVSVTETTTVYNGREIKAVRDVIGTTETEQAVPVIKVETGATWVRVYAREVHGDFLGKHTIPGTLLEEKTYMVAAPPGQYMLYVDTVGGEVAPKYFEQEITIKGNSSEVAEGAAELTRTAVIALGDPGVQAKLGAKLASITAQVAAAPDLPAAGKAISDAFETVMGARPSWPPGKEWLAVWRVPFDTYMKQQVDAGTVQTPADVAAVIQAVAKVMQEEKVQEKVLKQPATKAQQAAPAQPQTNKVLNDPMQHVQKRAPVWQARQVCDGNGQCHLEYFLVP